MSMARDTLALLPEMLMLVGAISALMVGSFLPRARQWITRLIAVVASVAAAAAGFAALTEPDSVIFDGSFSIGTATGAVRMIVPLATVLVLILGVEELRGSRRESETYSLMLLSALGAMMLAGANDLLVLGAAYLLASIPLYALIGMDRARGAAEAALKTYLLGAIFGIVMLAGITVLYGVGGATGYPVLSSSLAVAPEAAVLGGLLAVLAGLMFKAGAVPGHFWVPDAAQASGTAAAAFLTSVPKVGALVAAYRLVHLMPDGAQAPLLVALLAAATMTLGNLAAFWQNDVRRLLGWSTVSQAGYLLLPVAVAGRADLALPSLLFYLGAYAAANITAFAVIAALPGHRTLVDWRGVARAHPWLAAALVVSLLALVGTPPTAVFVGKLTTFTAAWDGGLGWLVVVAAVNTVASLFYYLRFVAPMFQWPAPSAIRPRRHAWAARAAVVGALAVIVGGVASGPLLTAVGAGFTSNALPSALSGSPVPVISTDPVTRIAVAGDTGTGKAAQFATADRMQLQSLDDPYDGLLILGDLIYERGDASLVGPRIIEPFAPITDGGAVLVPVLGNHDYDSGEQQQILEALGRDEPWYVETIGIVRIIVLDSNRVTDVAQTEWLRDTLAEPVDPDLWTIVAMHHSAYSAGEHGSDLEVRDAWSPLFEEFDVPLALAGHDHDYQRSLPESGVTYVVSGAGAKLRPAGNDEFTAVSESTLHYLDVLAYENRLEVRAINQSGTLVDEFTLSRG